MFEVSFKRPDLQINSYNRWVIDGKGFEYARKDLQKDLNGDLQKDLIKLNKNQKRIVTEINKNNFIAMKNLISKAGVPPIKFEFNNFFTFTFKRSETIPQKIENVPVNVPEIVPEIQRIIPGIAFRVTFRKKNYTPEMSEKTREKTREKILSILKTTPYITINELAEIVVISQKGVEWQIVKLKKEGRIKHIGPDKGGHWEVIK